MDSHIFNIKLQFNQIKHKLEQKYPIKEEQNKDCEFFGNQHTADIELSVTKVLEDSNV